MITRCYEFARDQLGKLIPRRLRLGFHWHSGAGLTGLTGSFAGRVLGFPAGFGLAVREAGGIVTGTAWSGISQPLCRGAIVAGSLAGSSVSLGLEPIVEGMSRWGFNGVFEKDRLQGELASAQPRARGYLIEAVRVEAIPTGQAVIRIRGPEVADLEGTATFGYDFYTGHPALVVETGRPFVASLIVEFFRPHQKLPADPLEVVRRTPLARGDYHLGGASPLATLALDPQRVAAPRYRATSGVVRVEQSNRITLGGYLELSVPVPGDVPLKISGKFSAGCTFGVW